jgi:lycopene beta-cyclase
MTRTSTTSPLDADVLLAGGGPAGLRLASELVERAIRVAIVEPDPGRFEASYGIFGHDLPEDLRGAVAAEWPAVRVLDDTGERLVALPYARLDSARLHNLLTSPCAGSCTWLRSRVARVVERDGVSVVHLDDGAVLRVRRVVDCTGHTRALGRPEHTLRQVALGATLMGVHGFEEPRFMDYSGPAHGTFLYALPVSETELFVEETALVTAGTPDWAMLERRLRARLAHLGLKGELSIHEHCVIPMDPSLPDVHAEGIAFGAAAAMVHPATGYQLGAALALAAPFAETLAATLDRSASEAQRRCFEVLWPSQRQHVRELRLFGARFVAGLGHRDQAAFFRAFFALPTSLVSAYLSHDAGLDATCRAMLRMYATLPARLRWSLTRAGVRQPMTLLRPLFELGSRPRLAPALTGGGSGEGRVGT